MGDSSPFASLGASLLARKGSARPAMRPQSQPILGASGGMDSLEDLGWNDMGDETPVHRPAVPLQLTPYDPRLDDDRSLAEDQSDDTHYASFGAESAAVPEVRRQQDALARSLSQPEEEDYSSIEPASESPLMVKKQALPSTPSFDEDMEEDEEAYAEELAPVVKASEVKKDIPAKVSAFAPVRNFLSRKTATDKSADKGKKAAFTLRLDAERHLKLRLACTVRNKSAQQIVTEALDLLLGEMPEIDSLASQLTRQ